MMVWMHIQIFHSAESKIISKLFFFLHEKKTTNESGYHPSPNIIIAPLNVYILVCVRLSVRSLYSELRGKRNL